MSPAKRPGGADRSPPDTAPRLLDAVRQLTQLLPLLPRDEGDQLRMSVAARKLEAVVRLIVQSEATNPEYRGTGATANEAIAQLVALIAELETAIVLAEVQPVPFDEDQARREAEAMTEEELEVRMRELMEQLNREGGGLDGEIGAAAGDTVRRIRLLILIKRLLAFILAYLLKKKFKYANALIPLIYALLKQIDRLAGRPGTVPPVTSTTPGSGIGVTTTNTRPAGSCLCSITLERIAVVKVADVGAEWNFLISVDGTPVKRIATRTVPADGVAYPMPSLGDPAAGEVIYVTTTECGSIEHLVEIVAMEDDWTTDDTASGSWKLEGYCDTRAKSPIGQIAIPVFEDNDPAKASATVHVRLRASYVCTET